MQFTLNSLDIFQKHKYFFVQFSKSPFYTFHQTYTVLKGFPSEDLLSTGFRHPQIEIDKLFTQQF